MTWKGSKGRKTPTQQLISVYTVWLLNAYIYFNSERTQVSDTSTPCVFWSTNGNRQKQTETTQNLSINLGKYAWIQTRLSTPDNTYCWWFLSWIGNVKCSCKRYRHAFTEKDCILFGKSTNNGRYFQKIFVSARQSLCKGRNYELWWRIAKRHKG